MAKEIMAWCDIHLASEDPERVPGRERKITIDNGAPRVLDMCDPCFKEHLAPVQELLDRYSQPVRIQVEQNADGSYPCPACGKNYVKRQSMTSHVQRKHPHYQPGDAPTPVRTSQPAQPSLLSQDDEGVVAAPYACPDCERTFETPQGLGAHRNRMHGYIGVSKRTPANA